MKNKIVVVRSEGYHPANIPTADVSQKQDEGPPGGPREVQRAGLNLYDCNGNQLIRKIGFK